MGSGISGRLTAAPSVALKAERDLAVAADRNEVHTVEAASSAHRVHEFARQVDTRTWISLAALEHGRDGELLVAA